MTPERQLFAARFVGVLFQNLLNDEFSLPPCLHAQTYTPIHDSNKKLSDCHSLCKKVVPENFRILKIKNKNLQKLFYTRQNIEMVIKNFFIIKVKVIDFHTNSHSLVDALRSSVWLSEKGASGS